MSWASEMKKEIYVGWRRKVIELLSKTPNGLRQREISSYTGIWVGDLVGVMADLESEKIITRTSHRDMANMEWYDIYKLNKNNT